MYSHSIYPVEPYIYVDGGDVLMFIIILGVCLFFFFDWLGNYFDSLDYTDKDRYITPVKREEDKKETCKLVDMTKTASLRDSLIKKKV